MRHLHLLLALVLAGCVRNAGAPPSTSPRQEDLSIQFPDVHEYTAVEVGEPGSIYGLDGSMLQAITVAANDFLPPDSEERACWRKREAHRFRVIRQGDLVFVSISLTPGQCRQEAGLLDYGATYAIGAGGRILRRVDGRAAMTRAQPSPPESESGRDAGTGAGAPPAELKLQDGVMTGRPSPGRC